MSDLAIRVENLSKKFRIGTTNSPGYHRLSEALTGIPRYAWKSLFPPRIASEPTALAAGSSLQPPTSSLPSANDFWALKDVSFEVKQGEVVGIIGRNGAGKSTLLKILSRITEPTSGRFGIRGRVASLLEVGTGFHPELTGRENIYVSGITLGMSRAEIKKRFDEIVNFSGVEKFLDTLVKHYSSGMQVRLGFAVAAHLESEILIVDEVLAVGDAEFQKKCLAKMRGVANSGRSLVFVSHNLAAVRAMCNSCIWLNEGKVMSSGPTSVVADHYMEKMSKAITVRSWDKSTAPGSDAVRLNRIAIRSTDDSRMDLPLSRGVKIEIDYCVLQDGLTLNPSLVIQSQDGTPVFNSFPALDPLTNDHTFSSGQFRSTCLIPPQFLNDEMYRIQLYMIRDRSICEWRFDDLLTFEMIDDLPRNGWLGKWIGIVRPYLDWTTSQLNETHTARTT